MQRGVDYIGVGVGAVIQNEEGKFFAALRGKQARNETGKWEFPGGGVEFGETMKDTIVREMKEEHDIEIEVMELLSVDDVLISEEKQHWVAPTFICRIKSGEPKILEPQKCDEIGWFTLKELLQMPLSIVTKLNIKSLKEKGFK